MTHDPSFLSMDNFTDYADVSSREAERRVQGNSMLVLQLLYKFKVISK